MNKITLYQVDAFTDKLFSGNPAGVCILDSWISDGLMQSISNENNLPETAFVVAKNEVFKIRWFTPDVEVDLCGHATLASAYVLFNFLNYNKQEIIFHSPKSGKLKVIKDKETLFLDFPSDILNECNNKDFITKCIGVLPLKVLKGKTDYIAVVNSEKTVLTIKPEFNEIVKINARGLIVTAKGDDVDFVSRFFAPQIGVNEDPVTGSAHTSLIPFWSKELDKKEMKAKQLSKRGGSLICINRGERCLIGGEARLYLKGEISIS